MPPYANCPRHWSRSAEDARLLGQVIDYYHETLKQSPEALDYLEKRGIADAEAIGRFKLGFANRGPGLSAAGEEPQGGSGRSGASCSASACCVSSGHEHFSGLAGDPGDRPSRGRSPKSMAASSTIICGKGTPLHLLPAGAASRRIQCRSLARLQGDYPLRIADRRPELLVCRI